MCYVWCELRDSNRDVTVAYRLSPREIPLCFVFPNVYAEHYGKGKCGSRGCCAPSACRSLSLTNARKKPANHWEQLSRHKIVPGIL